MAIPWQIFQQRKRNFKSKFQTPYFSSSGYPFIKLPKLSLPELEEFSVLWIPFLGFHKNAVIRLFFQLIFQFREFYLGFLCIGYPPTMLTIVQVNNTITVKVTEFSPFIPSIRQRFFSLSLSPMLFSLLLSTSCTKAESSSRKGEGKKTNFSESILLC